MSQSSLMLRKGGSSNGDHRALNSDDDIIRIPECDINDAKERFHLTLIGRTFTEIANALGKKLFVDDKKARIQVSIEADKPLQFERRIGFPNGDIGKVTLTSEVLHRHCFTCNLISHDENTCPQLTPEEREYKRKQLLENQANNDQTRLPIHGSQNSTSRSNELYRDEKRRKSTPSFFSTRETRVTTYQANDRKSSSREDNRQPHHGREVWGRLEIPTRWEDTHRGRSNNHHPRSLSRKEETRPIKKPSMEWRPRPNVESSRSKSNINIMPQQLEHDRMEGYCATYDSQKTISDKRASLESGEIVVTRGTEAENAVSEEEIIRRLKGKSIATDMPTLLGKLKGMIPLLKEGEKFIELDVGMDQDIDATITDLELAEVDNLVLETEGLEMTENMRDENMFDADNDDLLGDSPDFDAEKIEAITQLSPANAVHQEAAPGDQQLIPAKKTACLHDPVQESLPGAYVPKGLLKKRTPRSPDIKGAQASKKLQTLNNRASPKKKTISGKTGEGEMIRRTLGCHRSRCSRRLRSDLELLRSVSECKLPASTSRVLRTTLFGGFICFKAKLSLIHVVPLALDRNLSFIYSSKATVELWDVSQPPPSMPAWSHFGECSTDPTHRLFLLPQQFKLSIARSMD
ncbi:hypothetical protein Bca101_049736 [Brassica carinata]